MNTRAPLVRALLERYKTERCLFVTFENEDDLIIIGDPENWYDLRKCDTMYTETTTAQELLDNKDWNCYGDGGLNVILCSRLIREQAKEQAKPVSKPETGYFDIQVYDCRGGEVYDIIRNVPAPSLVEACRKVANLKGLYFVECQDNTFGPPASHYGLNLEVVQMDDREEYIAGLANGSEDSDVRGVSELSEVDHRIVDWQEVCDPAEPDARG